MGEEQPTTFKEYNFMRSKYLNKINELEAEIKVLEGKKGKKTKENMKDLTLAVFFQFVVLQSLH